MYCKNCGCAISNEMAFCSSCGSKIETDISNAPDSTENQVQKEITGTFPVIKSKIPLQLLNGENVIEQHSVAFVKSSIAQGTLSITNKRILFSKDGAGKAFFKRGGLIGMAMSSGADVPSVIMLNDIIKIQPTSCIQGKAAMIITVRSGYDYKIALQSMALGKTNQLCQARDRIVKMISDIL